MSRRDIFFAFSIILNVVGCGGTDSGNPSTNLTNRTGGGCSLDIKICSDGSTVLRDFNNNCEFKKCPDE